MAVEHKVVSFTVSHTVPSGTTYEQELANSWDAAISGAVAVSGVISDDWFTVNVERRDGGTYKSCYTIWLEKA